MEYHSAIGAKRQRGEDSSAASAPAVSEIPPREMIYNSSRTAIEKIAPKKTKRIIKSFTQRIEDLRAYKETHGHINVKEKEDKSLYKFGQNIRYGYNNPGKRVALTDDQIASLDALGFEWTTNNNNKKRKQQQSTNYDIGLALPTTDTDFELDSTPPALPPLCNLEGVQYKAGGHPIEKEVDVKLSSDEDGIEKVPV